MAGILYFLIFMLFQNILEANTATTIYNYKSKEQFKLANNTTLIKIDAVVNVKPIPGSKIFSAGVDKFEITFEWKEARLEVNLDKCPKFIKKYSEALQLPFTINKDNDGTMKSITVSSKDLDLSVDLKLLFASRFQVNEDFVQKNKNKSQFSGTATEQAGAGKCNMKYNAFKKQADFWLKLEYDSHSCSASDPDNSDQEYLADKCKQGSDLDLKWSVSGTTVVTVQGNSLDISKVIRNGVVSYFPFVNHKRKFEISVRETLNQFENDRRTSAPDFSDSDSNTVSQMRYIKVNRNMLNRGGDDAFNVGYRALACQSNFMHVYLGLFEQLLDCITR